MQKLKQFPMILSVRTKLLFGILAPVALLYLITAIFETRFQIRAAIEDAQVDLQLSIDKRAARLNTVFAQADAAMSVLCAYLEEFPDASREQIQKMFDGCFRRNPNLYRLFLAFDPDLYPNRKDNFICVYRQKDKTVCNADIQTYDFSEPAYRVSQETHRVHWSEPYLGTFPEKVDVCTLSHPFYNGQEFAGVLMLDLTLDQLREIVQVDAFYNVRFSLVSPQGTIISDSCSEFEKDKTVSDLAVKYNRLELISWAKDVLNGRAEIIRLPAADNDLPEANIWNNKTAIWVAAARMPENEWTLFAAIIETGVLKPIYSRLFWRTVLFAVSCSLIIGVVWFVSFYVMSSLKHLTAFADKLSSGNLDAVVQGKLSNDEFGQLAKTFGKMTGELKLHIEDRMKEQVARQTLENEFNVARRIQLSLVPHTFPPYPHRKEFELFAKNEPTEYIAGDFYDFFFLDDDTLALIMADVSGHGIPAALFMAVTRTAIRNFAVNNTSPKKIIECANKVLAADNEDNMFVTLFLASYSVSTGKLNYVNAGHNPPYIAGKDGTLVKLASTGTMLAVFQDSVFEEKTAELNIGDSLIAYTDGVVEAQRDEKLFGDKKLQDMVSQSANQDAREICLSIFTAVEQFDGGIHQDDVTVLTLKRIQ